MENSKGQSRRYNKESKIYFAAIVLAATAGAEYYRKVFAGRLRYLSTSAAILPDAPIFVMTGSGDNVSTERSVRPMSKTGRQRGSPRSLSCRTSAGPPKQRRVRQRKQLTRYGDLRDTPPARPPIIMSTPIAGSWSWPKAKDLQTGTNPGQKSERLTSNVRIAWGAVAERLKAAVC